MKKKVLRTALFLFVLSLSIWLSAGAVPTPPEGLPGLPEDSLLDAGTTASTDSASQIVEGGAGATGSALNASRQRTNTSIQQNQTTAQNQNGSANGSADTATQTNDAGQITDETGNDENQMPVEEKPGSNTAMIIVLSVTSILIVVAIILILNNLRKNKTPKLPQQTNYGFQNNGVRQPIGAGMTAQTAQISQPRIMQQRQVQPPTIIRTQRLATPLTNQQNIKTIREQQLDQKDIQKIQPLVDYLTNTFGQGYSIQDVQPHLKSSGWNDDDIKKALEIMNLKRNQK